MLAATARKPSRLFPDMRQPKPWWQPGMLLVKFRSGVQPRVVAPIPGQFPQLQCLNGVDLDDFHALARNWRARNFQHLAGISSAQTGASQEPRAQSPGQSDALEHSVLLLFDRNAPVENIAADFQKLACVEAATLVPRFSGSALPNDQYLGSADSIQTIGIFESQWYIFHCHADKAWDIATGAGVTINVIDEGFDADHEDLRAKVDAKFNSTTGSPTISTASTAGKRQLDHGTAAAGLAAAAGNNNVGIAGFAYNARLRLIQAFKDPASNDPNVPANNVPQAIKWAKDQAAASTARNVISISLGVHTGPYEQIPIDADSNALAAIVQATAKSVVCISAGNTADALGRDVSIDLQGKSFDSNAIVVGAMRKNPNGVDIPGNTNWGWRMTVCAPGDDKHDMTCASGSEGYTPLYGGSSGATPKVAGTAALMLEANPKLTHEQVKAILNYTGKPLPGNNYERPFGPVLDSFAAVKAAQEPASGPKLIANRFVNFGNIPRGQPGQTQLVKIFNIGVAPLNLKPVTQTSGSPDFKVTSSGGIPGPVDPGGYAKIYITFTPSSNADVDATFSVESDNPGPPLLIQCTGTSPSSFIDYLTGPFRWIGRHPVATGVGVAAIVVIILLVTGEIHV